MSDGARKPIGTHGKKPIDVLRERRGIVPPELVERNRQLAATRRQIVAALKESAKTVPEIAKETGVPKGEVFWHLMAMKKYGKLIEVQEREEYFEYALAKTPGPTEATS